MSEALDMNPFVGLRPFEAGESILFFGRQEQTVELLNRLHEHHFVGVVGSSGSGKSSLIRAGLIPRLKGGYLVNERDQWLIPVFKPGEAPLFNFASALLNELQITTTTAAALVQKIKEEGADAILELLKNVLSGNRTNVFILVDQFEELFRFSIETNDAEKKDEAIDFVNILLALSAHALPVYIVITMRSDFIGDCAQFFGLPEALNQSQYLVPRLTRVQLKNAIEGPVRLYGGKIEAALTSYLLNDVHNVKDELPLLQHVLMRIWDHEVKTDHSGELTLDDYKAVGGIEKALSIHADEAIAGMQENEKQIAKLLFQALTTIDKGGRKIRRPAHLSELVNLSGASADVVNTIIAKFNADKRSFLVINNTANVNDPLIDISHESLIRQWDTLNAWVDEETDSAKTYLHLSEAAALEKEGKKDLITGTELQVAWNWRDKYKPGALWATRYNKSFDETMLYLEKSKTQFETEKKEKEEKQRKRLRRTMIIAGVIGVFALLALGAAIFALRAKKETEKQSDLANGYNLIWKARNVVGNDPTLALQFGGAAMLINEDSTIARETYKIYSENVFYKIVGRQENTIYSVAFSPDGKTILTGSGDSIARLWDLDGKLIREFKGHRKAIVAVAFSPGGKNILTGSADSTARLWDIDGKFIREFRGHTGGINGVAFSSTGDSILTASDDTTARLWNFQEKTMLREFRGHINVVNSVAFSPDGKSIVTASKDGYARVWPLYGNETFVLPNNGPVKSAIFTPDGKYVLTSGADGRIILFDMYTHTVIFNGHMGAVLSIAFSPDGKHFLSGSNDNTARLWDIDDEKNVVEFKGHTGAVNAVAFSPDGNTILTGSRDKTFRVWKVKSDLIQVFRAHTETINSVAFSKSGDSILTGSSDNEARLWNREGKEIAKFTGHTDYVRSVSISPDGRSVLTGSNDFTVRLWDINGTNPKVLNVGKSFVNAVAFSSTGDSILTGSQDSVVRLLDRNGKIIKELRGHSNVVRAVAFSPDGKMILSGSEDSTARLWSLDKKINAVVFKGHKSHVTCVAFSSDGKMILTGSLDNTARLWDLKGNLIREFTGHTKSVSSVAFSPDRKTILTGSLDNTARLWDLKGNMIREFKGHYKAVNAVAFSSHGQTILTGSADGTVRLWNVPMDLQEFLRSNDIEHLSQEQKKSNRVK